MRLSEFDVPFDPTLIASQPIEPRDAARLLVVERRSGVFHHERVADLPQLLATGDLLVANDTKVLPARLLGRKPESGRLVEILFVRPLNQTDWNVLMKGRFRVGQQLDLAPDARAVVLRRDETGTILRVDSARAFREVMDEVGRMPLPPYIKREPDAKDRDWYQTTFAREEGAIAAPTAGLHVTDRLRAGLAARGVEWATVTLHVGPGTFKPVTVERVEEHRMDPERVTVPIETAEAIRGARRCSKRVVAIGTTVVRALESSVDGDGQVAPGSGNTALFITPGYRFRAVDALLTNFHLPKTTLVMLVSAFAGLELIREAYRIAVQERYRFYSYGDAMLIL